MKIQINRSNYLKIPVNFLGNDNYEGIYYIIKKNDSFNVGDCHFFLSKKIFMNDLA